MGEGVGHIIYCKIFHGGKAGSILISANLLSAYLLITSYLSWNGPADSLVTTCCAPFFLDVTMNIDLWRAVL